MCVSVCGPGVALTQQRRRVGTFLQFLLWLILQLLRLLLLLLRLLGRPGEPLQVAVRRGRAVPCLLVLGEGKRVVQGADVEDDGDGDVEETQQHQQLAGPLEPVEGSGRIHGHRGPLVPSQAEPNRDSPRPLRCSVTLR